jgi:hypothetical protein
MLGNFDAKLEKEDIFKSTIWNENLHEDSNNNGVRIVTSPHQKIYLLRVGCYLTEKLKNISGTVLTEKITTRSITY